MPKQLEPIYRESLTKSWQLLLHHKLLWVLGAMAMLVGQFGLGNFLGSLWIYITKGQVTLIPWLPRELSWPVLSVAETWQFAALLVVMLTLFGLITIVATCAQGTIIAAGVRYASGKKIPHPHLGTLWHIGAEHFWRLLVINIVQQIVLLFTVSSLLGFWRDFSHGTLGGMIMLVIGMTLGLFIALFTSVLSIYTAIFVVDKEYTLSEAVGAGYDLFKNHILVSLEISVILLLLSILPVIAIWFAAYLVIIPVIPFWLIGAFSGSVGTALVGTMVGETLFAVLVALIGGAFNAFMIVTWTYCYRVMEKKGMPSRLAHHTRKIFSQEPKGRSRVIRGRVS